MGTWLLSRARAGPLDGRGPDRQPRRFVSPGDRQPDGARPRPDLDLHRRRRLCLLFLGPGGGRAAGLPLKIILGNDACWGVEKRLQQGACGEHVGCELREVRYDKFAEMLGATGIHVDDVGHLDDAVDRLVACPAPPC
ncbi:MAG: hypothetical protein IPG27_06240 [Ottowia sp.]|nr:hypothetical protein [Ottowia sp.]